MSDKKCSISPLPLGHVLKNSYQIQSVLAKGSFSWVYLAQNQKSKKTIVIKEYAPSLYAQRPQHTTWVKPDTKSIREFEVGLEIFFEEIRSLCLLRSDAIANVIDAFVWQDNAYMAMSYQAGLTLEQYIHQKINRRQHVSHAAFSLLDLLKIGSSIAGILRKIHRLGWLHLDIKPSNIYVTPQQKALLLDLGSAHQKFKSTPSSNLIYTPCFAAPEIFTKDQNQIGPWCDIYAFGACLYQMITHQVPNPSKDRLKDDVVEKKLGSLLDEGKRGLALLIKQMMSMNKEKRPGSFFMIEQELHKLLQIENLKKKQQEQAISRYLSSYTLVGSQVF